MQKVFLCVNSDIGRGNTIGTRFGHIAKELLSKGYGVEIFARTNYDPALSVATLPYQNYFARALKIFRLYIFPWFTFRALDVWLFDRCALRYLRKKKSIDFDIAHFGEPAPQSMLYLQRRGVRIALDMPIGHYAYRRFLEEKKVRVGVQKDDALLALNRAIDIADTVIAPSPFVVETLRLAGFGEKDIRVVPFGVAEQKEFSSADLAQRSSQKELLFLFAGNINYRKGIPYLLDAWEKARLPNARLLLCGRVFKEVRKEIQKRTLHNVDFVGFVDMRNYLKKSHVFVFPTLLEGSSKAVYEAMSYGLVVITTPNAGSIITSGSDGFLIPVGDSEALAEAMRQVALDRTLRVTVGEAAMKTASLYPWERYSRSVIDVYSSLLSPL